jgi:hypothetical protein
MQTQSTQYEVAIKHVDGKMSYLSHRDRMAWTLRTARKHAKDCTAKIVAGQWPDVKYVAVVLA